jgi:hypothetical protein
MAWANSKIFTTFITDILNNTTAMDLNTDALLEVALYNNTTAPDQTVTSANSAYAVGQWVVGNGVSDATGWPALGRPLVSVTSVFATNVYTFDAADTVSANGTTTLAAVFGCLIYDHSAGVVTDQGICYNYFGGTNSVTSGTFTVVWNASGIMALTL